MTLIFIFVLADLILGLLAAHTLKEKFSSAKLKKTVSKTIAYEMAIVLGMLMETHLNVHLPVVNTISSLIILTEGTSLVENFKTITGIDLWKELLHKLHALKSIHHKDDENSRKK